MLFVWMVFTDDFGNCFLLVFFSVSLLFSSCTYDKGEDEFLEFGSKEALSIDSAVFSKVLDISFGSGLLMMWSVMKKKSS